MTYKVTTTNSFGHKFHRYFETEEGLSEYLQLLRRDGIEFCVQESDK